MLKRQSTDTTKKSNSRINANAVSFYPSGTGGRSGYGGSIDDPITITHAVSGPSKSYVWKNV